MNAALLTDGLGGRLPLAAIAAGLLIAIATPGMAQSPRDFVAHELVPLDSSVLLRCLRGTRDTGLRCHED
jgi:hypothetical protein